MAKREQDNILELSQSVSLSNSNMFFTWLKYADDEDGSNMSDNPDGKSYIGLAYNKTTLEESNNPEDYTWSRIRGDKGEVGGPGPEGKHTYIHIKYSNDGGISFTDRNGEMPGDYLGQYVDTKIDDSDRPSDYKWALIRGEDGRAFTVKGTLDTTEELFEIIGKEGEAYIVQGNLWGWIEGPDGVGTWINLGQIKGDPGEIGPSGKPAYLHIKYSDDGGKTFTYPNGETPGTWMGQYVDDQKKDSMDVNRYTWSKIKGDDGRSFTVKGQLGSTDELFQIVGKEGEAYIVQGNLWGWIIGPDGRGAWVDLGKIKGEDGKNGITLYTWIKYADDDKGTGMTDNPFGKAYIGIAYNKTSQVEINDYRLYTWSKIQASDFIIEGTLESEKDLPNVGQIGSGYIINGELWMWKIDPMTGIGAWANMGQFIGGSTIIAERYYETILWDAIQNMIGKVKVWIGVTNWKKVNKGDILIVPVKVGDKKDAICNIHCDVMEQPTTPNVKTTVRSVQMGPEGNDGSSVVMAKTIERTKTWSEIERLMGTTQLWNEIHNWSFMDTDDTMIIPIKVSDKKYAICHLYCTVTQKPTSQNVYGRVIEAQMGPEGPQGVEGPLLDWVQDWDRDKHVMIGGNKICSPRIFAGQLDNVWDSGKGDYVKKPTGVALGKEVFGTLEGFRDVNGICAYDKGNQTFSITTQGQVFFGDPSGTNGLISYKNGNLSITAPTITLAGRDLKNYVDEQGKKAVTSTVTVTDNGLFVYNGKLEVRNTSSNKVMWVEDGKLTTNSLVVNGNGNNTVNFTGGGSKSIKLATTTSGSLWLEYDRAGNSKSRIGVYGESHRNGQLFIEPGGATSAETPYLMIRGAFSSPEQGNQNVNANLWGTFSVSEKIYGDTVEGRLFSSTKGGHLIRSRLGSSYNYQIDEMVVTNNGGYVHVGTYYNGAYAIPINTSDAYLKKNIDYSKNIGLSEILKIEHASYTYINTDETIENGYIAQQLQMINKNWVLEVPQDLENPKSEVRLQPLSDRILPYATKAIQEQQEEIEKLKKENVKLEKDIKIIKEKLNIK